MNEKDELLSQLRDVELPEVAGTLAPGWWILLFMLLVLLYIAYFFYQRRHARLWQRQARAELNNIRKQYEHQPSMSVLMNCSELARKVVLAVDQREQVAALHGEAWLEKLDELCARPEFTQGIGRLLLDQPYKRKPIVAEQDVTALLESMEVLISSAAKYKPQLKSSDAPLAELDDTVRSTS